MDFANWINSLNELLKNGLFIWGILGYSFNKKYNIKNLVFYIVISVVLFWALEFNELRATLAITGLFIAIFLEGSILAKGKVFLMASLTVSMGDLFLLSFWGVIFPQTYLIDTRIINIVFDIFWVALALGLHKYRKNINEYFTALSTGGVFILFIMLFSMTLMAGGTQYLLSREVTYELKRFILFLQMLATILITTASVVLCYYVVTKKNIEFVMEKEREKYILEKRIYEERFKKNEEIQKFRHDMKKHMKIIRQLCEELSQEKFKAERLKEYVDEFLDNYPEQVIVYTGSIISDYFISELICKLNHNDRFQYNVLGRLPEKVNISDADFSILLGNALDNAANELIKIEGECYFEIVFKNYNGHVMITIKNSKMNAKRYTNITPVDGHGYGIKNMQEVVKRYNGTLDITETDKMFSVEIFI